MTAAAVVAIAVVVLAAGGALAVGAQRRRRRQAPTPAARRILFPLAGGSLSIPALDAALRIARAEGAVLVPGYLARVPLDLALDTALPVQAETALAVLEAVELRASRQGVEVDSRIERGRTYRHALRQLVEHERHDRMVVAAGTLGEGFSAGDVAWLLEHVPGEVVVLRAAGQRGDGSGARR